jgi:predicted AlkP superfamily phosphohydrolase/phosphomutase
MKNEYLMIGWSGADWRVANPLIDQGLMPQLANIVNNGVIGSLTGFAPQVAPMLWKTIATGKHPHQHNVSGATKEDTCRCGSIW